VAEFYKKCFKKIFDQPLLQKIEEGKINYNLQSEKNQIQVIKEVYPDGGAWTMSFDFIKNNTGFKFYECDSFGGPVCCR